MAFHPIPNVARLTLRMQGPQLQVVSVGSYWRLAGEPTPFDQAHVNALAAAGDTNVSDAHILDGAINTSCTYLGCEAKALDAVDAPVAFDATHAGPGGVTAVLLPMETALVFAFLGGLPGRSHRNRWYWPFCDVAMLDTSPRDGLFSAATIAAWHATFLTFFDAVASAGFHAVVASPKHGSYIDQSSWVIRRRPGSQRRREP